MATSIVKWMIAAMISGLPQHHGDDFVKIHPFFVSVTEINHNERDKTLEISIKVFLNDFEAALEKTFKAKVDLNNLKNKNDNDKMIRGYLLRHLQISVDNKMQSMQFVGSENKSESVWSYFQIDNVPSVRKIDIRNDILYDSFETEINIMHVTVSGIRKSLEVTNPNTNATFGF